ncbi:actin-like protein arp8 [Coemansia sp. RSA 1813]|nr:actin-like protein arp8 [Coemansia sp. RSA 1646]KAJ1770193.1 actin-like protein arp8 [Coemansia sp. RSA 1843]KAJ2090010.1 actin-like protein arp8 [Coemansia sp. RSA 986]KAJ2217029.1 actin-like protein arp8 [Coemansia sp. RSA 487]KAJ2566544.1 actin-like protein arp8 [Coemansia sp. RSA 1813]
MSGFPLKRKKYSWLPESNPSALSGDTMSSASSSKKSESEEKTPRQPRSRSKTSGKGKAKERVSETEQLSDKPSNVNDPAMVVDVLGISTSAPKELSTTPTSADTNEETPAETGVNDSQEPNGASDDDDTKHKPASVSTKIRRRPRKDSVDDLVRSRFISHLSAQHEGGAPSGSGSSRSRKRIADPALSTITASVRDALASERSGHMRIPSGVNASHDVSTTSLPAMAGVSNGGAGDVGKGSRHRNAASRRYGHLHHDNNHSSVSTPGRPFAQMPAVQQPRLGPLESKYSFPAYPSLNPRNVTSTMRRGDHGVGPLSQARGLEVPTGENVVVINAGSRWLRIGRASDAVPKEIPHVIARKRKAASQSSLNGRRNGYSNATGSAQVPVADGTNHKDGTGNNHQQTSEIPTGGGTDEESGGSGEMDVDKDDEARNSKANERSASSASNSGSGDEGGDSDEDNEEDILKSLDHEDAAVDSTLKMLRDALKQHQRQSKRKVPPNVYSQVLTYNKQSKPETIVDHNDPFRIEWIPSSEIEEDHLIGEKVLHIADADDFIIRYPIRNGYLNVEDYEGIEEVLGDIETIWTTAIQTELGINRRDLKAFGAVLVIPDLYNRVEVIALAEVLLRRMGFQYLLVQQSSTLVTYGAGFSTACVVDVGAQKTSIACIEDGFCYQESRVNVMYGADDITRFLYHLFMSSKFPYREASLGRMYDWHLLNGLRERYCTMNLSDVNIRLHDFFVRIPNQPTRKLSFKTYDEAYQAPLCLFYPAIVAAYCQLPDYSQTFASASYPETYGEVKPVGCSTGLTPTQFGILPSRAIETEAEPALRKPTPDAAMADSSSSATAAEAAIAPATVPSTEPGTPDLRDQSAGTPTPVGKQASASAKDALQPENAATSHTSPSTPSIPSVSYVPDTKAQDTRMPLDAAITHSIVHAGSMDRAKKLYSSIVIVGGGVSFIPGFDDLLSSRIMYMRPDYLQGVERAEIVSAPRDLDPRVLAWKGGAVLSRLECAREMWISSREWADFGPKLLRDRVLFPW